MEVQMIQIALKERTQVKLKKDEEKKDATQSTAKTVSKLSMKKEK